MAKLADFDGAQPSAQTVQVADWILASGDNRGGSFIIVDKSQAHVYVFKPDGKLRGAAPALLGLARGDDSVPGIGGKKLADIRPDERTTPAGRFVAEMGINAHGKDIVWVDYDAAVSMHRVLTSNPAQRRPERLASTTPKDNRISYGCINLPAPFYEKVVSATVQEGRTIIYVLPETRPAAVVFGFSPNETASARRSAASIPARRHGIDLRRLDGA